MSITEPETEAMRPSMKERQRQLREDAILDAAVDFLQTKGFNAMTLEDITESIGISRPTLYQHFCSKEEMVVYVALRNLLRGAAKLGEMDPGRPPLDRLIEFIDWGMLNRFGSCRCVFTDIAHIVLAARAKNERYRAAENEFKERFTDLIREAQISGDVRTDIRARLLAETIMAIFKSASFDEIVQKGFCDVPEVRECIFKLLKPCVR